MSALGQKQTSDWGTSMSALPPKADIHERSVPNSDIALFNYLVGTHKNRGRNIQTECLGGLVVDYQLELGRELHR
jgi:hypothetical protein